MKEAKYSPVGSSSSSSIGSSSSTSSTSSTSSNAGNVVVRFWNPTFPAHFSAGLVSVTVVSFMIFMQIRDNLETGLWDDIQRMIHPPEPPAEVDMPQYWNYSSHEFLPIISDWDEQRVRWIEEDTNLKLPTGSRPRVLMVSGSSQEEGELYILSHLLLRAVKNKQDYTQMHDMELYYNMVNPDPEFSDWWVKLPVIRMLMLRHPEVEWIWWLDADAVITDMTFEPPFAQLHQYNLVLYGEDRLVHDNLDRTGLSTGAFMIRNCQWSLDLLGAWAYAGTNSKREEAGDAKFQDIGGNKTAEIVSGDDRSSLLALLAQDKRTPTGQQQWVPKVKLLEEAEYALNGNWTVVGPKLEELSYKDHVVPFITHFEGCLPNPSEVPKFSRQDSENFNACVEQLNRAFDFAENQVFKELGLERNTLGNSSEPFIWKNAGEAESALTILPIVRDWDQKRKAYLDSKPWTKKDQVVIVSGSQSTPCPTKEGAHLLVRGLKNKIDYTRVHGIRIFYNMAVIHTSFRSWWAKMPALKLMMMNSIDVEWVWWTDSDALFTKMDFAIPFERYNANGHNLVLYGNDDEVFNLKQYTGVNAGVMLIRNCQWSFDLFDRWASLSNITEDSIRKSIQKPLGWAPDDQSVLVYLLVTEREKWASKVFFEDSQVFGSVVMSGSWQYWTPMFVDEYKLRTDERPLVTHFTGCHICDDSYPRPELCHERFDRTLNFADNQMLEIYGLRHERLNSSCVTGDFQRNAQEWTQVEIQRMTGIDTSEGLTATEGEVNTTKQEEKAEEQVTNTKEGEQMTSSKDQVEGLTTAKEEEKLNNLTNEQEEVATTKEMGKVFSKEKQQEVTTTMEEKVEPTKEQEVTTTKEEKVEPSKEQGVTTTEENVEPGTEEQEVTSTKEEKKVEPTTEQEEVTTPKEEKKVEPTEEQEEVTTTKEEKNVEPTKEQEEVTTTKEQKKLEPTNEQEELTTTKEEKVVPTEEVTVDPTKEQEGKTQPETTQPKEEQRVEPTQSEQEKVEPGRK